MTDSQNPGTREAAAPAAAAPRRDAAAMVRDLAGRAGILIPFLVALAVLAIASTPFRRFENLSNILDQQSGIIIVAAAMTLVLIAGGIDLSVGAVYGLAGATATQLVGTVGIPLAIAAGLAIGVAVGFVNGLLVTRFRINALIGTLAMTYVVGGIGAIATKGNLIVAFDHPEFQKVAVTRFFGITSAAWTMVVIAIVVGLVLSRSTFGRYVYATGGNAVAARLGGVRIDGVRVATFILSGAAAALAGILDGSRVLSMQNSGGSFLTFTVLAGVVVGGTSILGGEGAIWRTVIGCLFIALVGNGFNLLGLDPFYQQIALGAILLLAVGVDAWSRRYRQ
jgi:ribose transport system permease protein